VIFIFIYGCSSSVPNKYALQIESLKSELIKTKAMAKHALEQISSLEQKLSKKITMTDSLIVEHKNETLLLRASDAFQKGNYALVTKQYKNAIKYYKKTIDLRPNDAHAYNNLGNVYKEMKNYPLAIVAYQNAIMLKPDYASAHYNLGIVHQESNNFDIALESYLKAASLAHWGVQKWLKDSGYYY
tara:strand:- start:99 stop:656 length:558 start_codon:yes stop_codon:yes gene_type:complete